MLTAHQTFYPSNVVGLIVLAHLRVHLHTPALPPRKVVLFKLVETTSTLGNLRMERMEVVNCALETSSI